MPKRILQLYHRRRRKHRADAMLIACGMYWESIRALRELRRFWWMNRERSSDGQIGRINRWSTSWAGFLTIWMKYTKMSWLPWKMGWIRLELQFSRAKDIAQSLSEYGEKIWLKYVAKAEQLAEVLTAINWFITLIPAMIGGVNGILYLFYPISSEKHREIMKELIERRGWKFFSWYVNGRVKHS